MNKSGMVAYKNYITKKVMISIDQIDKLIKQYYFKKKAARITLNKTKLDDVTS